MRRRNSVETQGSDTGPLANSSRRAAAEQEILFLSPSLPSADCTTNTDAAGLASQTPAFDTGTALEAVQVLVRQPSRTQQPSEHAKQIDPTALHQRFGHQDILRTPQASPAPHPTERFPPALHRARSARLLGVQRTQGWLQTGSPFLGTPLAKGQREGFGRHRQQPGEEAELFLEGANPPSRSVTPAAGRTLPDAQLRDGFTWASWSASSRGPTWRHR